MVTFRNNRTLKRAILATALAVLAPWSARAVYYAPGYDLQVVSSAQGLVNGAVNYQTNGLWGTSAVSTPLTTHFTLSACDTVAFSRLYLDLWGRHQCQDLHRDGHLKWHGLGRRHLFGHRRYQSGV